MTMNDTKTPTVQFYVETFKKKTDDIDNFFEDGLTQLGLHFSESQKRQIFDYIDLIIRWNRAYNLTSVRDPQDILVRHIFDSLAALPYLHGNRVLDVGSGAGLPGIPLAIANPDLNVTLIDSNGKKTRFLFQVVQALRLKNVQVVQARVEGFQKSNVLSEVSRYQKFETIISRAYTSLREMLYSTEHLCSNDGVFLAMKGVYPLTEIHEIPAEFKLDEVVKVDVPFLDGERHLIKIQMY